jgi:hypothetical protein
MRDPIDRVVSWWTYQHPANLAQRPDHQQQEDKDPCLRTELRKLYDCYPSFQALAGDGLAKQLNRAYQPNNERSVCQRIAYQAVSNIGSSNIPSLEEVDFSYKEHQRDFQIDPAKYFVLLAVRLERMVTDPNGIEAMLTHKSSNIFQKEEAQELKAQSSSESWPVTTNVQELDRKAMNNLCRRMSTQIQMYKFFLREAINLIKNSYKRTIGWNRNAPCKSRWMPVKKTKTRLKQLAKQLEPIIYLGT